MEQSDSISEGCIGLSTFILKCTLANLISSVFRAINEFVIPLQFALLCPHGVACGVMQLLEQLSETFQRLDGGRHNEKLLASTQCGI